MYENPLILGFDGPPKLMGHAVGTRVTAHKRFFYKTKIHHHHHHHHHHVYLLK